MSCSIVKGEDGYKQELSEPMCKGLCYPEIYPEFSIGVASVGQA